MKASKHKHETNVLLFVATCSMLFKLCTWPNPCVDEVQEWNAAYFEFWSSFHFNQQFSFIPIFDSQFLSRCQTIRRNLSFLSLCCYDKYECCPETHTERHIFFHTHTYIYNHQSVQFLWSRPISVQVKAKTCAQFSLCHRSHCAVVVRQNKQHANKNPFKRLIFFRFHVDGDRGACSIVSLSVYR